MHYLILSCYCISQLEDCARPPCLILQDSIWTCLILETDWPGERRHLSDDMVWRTMWPAPISRHPGSSVKLHLIFIMGGMQSSSWSFYGEEQVSHRCLPYPSRGEFPSLELLRITASLRGRLRSCINTGVTGDCWTAELSHLSSNIGIYIDSIDYDT